MVKLMAQMVPTLMTKAILKSRESMSAVNKEHLSGLSDISFKALK